MNDRKNVFQLINWKILAVFLAAVAGFFYWGLQRLTIDANIINSLPSDSMVLRDAREIFNNSPLSDKIVIDVSLEKDDLSFLVDRAEKVEKALLASGLFREVGNREYNATVPLLVDHVLEHLPILFSSDDLTGLVEPLLTDENIQNTLLVHAENLENISSIGQAKFLSKDPLGFTGLVMKRYGSSFSDKKIQFTRGCLLSEDSRHLLIAAEPAGKGSDTSFGKKIIRLLEQTKENLNNEPGASENRVIINHAGVYRAALDNERIIKSDIQLALFLSTLGIILLLVFSFRRPGISFLALVPAVCGLLTSVFVYSLFYRTISLLAFGFGGAIISITIDHAIAYISFLQQDEIKDGKEAAQMVWSVGFFAMLTTVCAFLSLYLSGFLLLAQIGLFASLGIVLSFVYVHTVFPLILPEVPQSEKSERVPVIEEALQKFSALSSKGRFVAAGIFFLIMIFFARPSFLINLKKMNSVSKETLASEQVITETWGNVYRNTYIVVTAPSLSILKKRVDGVTAQLEASKKSGQLKEAFSFAYMFPGTKRKEANQRAWNRFWTGKRTAALRRSFARYGSEAGFSHNAFNSFFASLGQKVFDSSSLTPELFKVLFISKKQASGGLHHVISVQPGPAFVPIEMYNTFSREGVHIFNTDLFNSHLGEKIADAFIKMLLIIGITVLVLIFIFFADWKLAAIAYLPIVFAMVATLGSLTLLGHSIDIPGLMLSIVILGMGIDYSLYTVRSYQRGRSSSSLEVDRIRLSVFLAGASTLTGFFALVFAEHTLLKSVGVTSSIGIFFAIAGVFFISPYLLERLFVEKEVKEEAPVPGSRRHFKEAFGRYRYLDTYGRMFAYFKMKLDPMFPRLHEFAGSPRVVIDIGCGYAVPSVWLSVINPSAEFYCLDPDAARTGIAAHALGSQAAVMTAAAPDIPKFEKAADTVLMLDMVHYLSDENLRNTLEALRASTANEAVLICRATVPTKKKFPWERWIEEVRIFFHGMEVYLRSLEELTGIIEENGFFITFTGPTAENREEMWLIAQREK